MNILQNSKRILSGILGFTMAATLIPCIPAAAEEAERYPYTIFAASNADGAITINANNFCANGSIATNGTIVSSGNVNVNGNKTENANEDMIYIQKKLNYSYFSGSNVELYADDYTLEDLNININNPMDVNGTLELTGNINLNSGIKALEDVNLNGEVKNANNSVIFSETGDININTVNTNFSGLIYAPYGDIVIDTDNLNLNNVVIIGQTITLDCPNINANYSTYMAELVGTESDIDIELYAIGEYNSEANSIDIGWFSNYENCSYEIWISDDNTSYTSVAVVTDSMEYQYAISEDFDTKYFKVSLTTNYGEYIESIPFKATKDEDGYTVDFLDSDEDGLPDVFEVMLGTDIDNIDSDDDGLTDYHEVYITGTNPTKYDSVTEGISDSDADSDGDGLSNAQEIEFGTDPQLSDTDDDNLSDYDELYVYGTDPLKADTDEDGLDDDSELKFELDPNNPETYGIPDGEYQISQSISSDNKMLSSINTEDSPFELSIDIKTNGDAEKEIDISQSAYSNAIENDAMIGASLVFSISDTCNPEEIVLKYSIKDTYIDNTLNIYSSLEEFQGIKRLNIFKFYEDTNMLLPIETKFDAENGLLYAEVDELGTYCIMDVEIWFNNLGVEMPEESQHEESVMYFNSPSILSASEYSGSVWTPTYVNAPIDLVFILQSAGTSSSYFDEEKQLIIDFVSSVIKDYSNVKITVIEFKKDKAHLLKDVFGRKYFTNTPMLFAALNNIEYIPESDYCDRGQAFEILLNDISLNYENNIYVYELLNGKTACQTSYDNRDVISEVKNNKIRAYSEIMPSGWHYLYTPDQEMISNAITDNRDLFITLNSNTLSAMKTHFPTKLSPARPVYNIIVPTNWKTISLKGELNPNNNIDTDEDTLTDWEEVDTDRLIWNEDGSFDIPTLDIAEIVALFKRFDSADYSFLIINYTPRRFLPIFSDPANEDSDGDGLLDGEPKKCHTEKCDNEKSDNCKIMLPIDPHPLCYDGPKGVWNAQKKVVERNDISTGYGSDNDGKNKLMNDMADNADTLVNILLKFKKISNKNLLNFIRKYIKGFAESETSTKAGADFLDFIYDNKNIAYHSQVDTWQKAFGYNDIYDDVFDGASKMLFNKITFLYNEEKYILWSWKGDYWNLQSGAETGLYVYNRTVNGVDHYDVVDFNLPMTLSLYNLHDGYAENVFSWVPDDPQWWITGFNPDFTEPDPNTMSMICSVQFPNEEFYRSFFDTHNPDKATLIFDDDNYTVWIMW